ncbi:hypothetical protein FACS189475_05310 [Betaproteobacteria bacterium]|nr:hypothetical protein FACS189475_05310 [Betaproteobacteria bacterium]
MFIFGKKDETNYDILLIKSIIKKLPEKYDYLKRQVEEGIIVGINILKYDDFHQVELNNGLYSKYEQKNFRGFYIENIILKQKDSNDKINITLSVAEGILMGYFTNTKNVSGVSFENIEIENIKIKYHFDESIKNIFTKDELKYINLSDVYEVELDGKIYYHVYELEDGDFIGIDKGKKLYKITHDPYEIKLMKEKLIEYLKNEE